MLTLSLWMLSELVLGTLALAFIFLSIILKEGSAGCSQRKRTGLHKDTGLTEVVDKVTYSYSFPICSFTVFVCNE